MLVKNKLGRADSFFKQASPPATFIKKNWTKKTCYIGAHLLQKKGGGGGEENHMELDFWSPKPHFLELQYKTKKREMEFVVPSLNWKMS